MAIDHASYFVARVHPFETWGTPPPYYESAIAFVTRWITHLCAPGFFLLMGAGMVWFAESRRAAGWTTARIRRALMTRGGVLILVQQFVENPAWLIGMLTGSPEAIVATSYPGGSGDAVLFMGVITALGVALIFWAFWIDSTSGVIWQIAIGAVAVTLLMTPPPAISPGWLRWLVIPGVTGVTQVLYPFLPWLAPAGLGIVMGRMVTPSPALAFERLAGFGIVSIMGFVILRLLAVGDPHPPHPGVIGFLTITKYPPSLAFFTMTIGLDLVLLWILARTRAPWLAPLEVFGRVPLFFYLLHLYVFGIASIFFRDGAGFAAMYGVWAVGLVAMYPLCRWYAGFKASRPIDSLWRLF